MERDEASPLSNAPSTHARRFLEAMGTAADLMGACRNYSLFQVACLRLWVAPAIRHKQITFFYNVAGNPVGYVTWALLAPDVEHKLVHDPLVLFHESEWNEGETLWIMDIIAPFGHARELIRELRRGPYFEGHGRAHSIRRRADGTVRKVSQWRR